MKVLKASLFGGVALAAALALQPSTSAQSGATVDPSLYSGMRWRSVGPARGGRSLAVAGSEARPLEYWFGATGGGVWKTTDGGSTWTPMTDGKINTSSIGSLAVVPSNPDVVYIGGGESQLRGNIIQGDGVYKTTDGGKWITCRTLRDSQVIAQDSRPSDQSATSCMRRCSARSTTTHPERGVFDQRRRQDLGAHAVPRREDRRRRPVDRSEEPRRALRALWEVYRTPWSM